MSKKALSWLLILGLLATVVSGCEPKSQPPAKQPEKPAILQEHLDALTAFRDGIDMEKNLEILLAANLPPELLLEKLSQERTFKMPERFGWFKDHIQLAEDYSLQFTYYVPENYDPTVKYPVVILLHGGVSTPQPIEPENLWGLAAMWDPLINRSDAIWIVPQGSDKSPWWNDFGHKMVVASLFCVKRELNVDTNRVLITGFSDGGSGSYYFNAVEPTPFAAFWPLNGMLAVAGIGGDEIYVRNLKNRPMYIVNTQLDSLYPPAYYRPMVAEMKKAGATLEFRDFPDIRHAPLYFDSIASETFEIFKNMKRDPWHGSVSITSSDLKHPRVDWLEITKLGSTMSGSDFDPHTITFQGRPRLGVTVSMQYEGPGVLIETVAEESYASQMGIMPSDVIVKFDGKDIADMQALQVAIRNASDEIAVTVKRGDENLTFESEFTAAPTTLFAYPGVPGIVEGSIENNVITLLTSKVAKLRIYISPEMAASDLPIVVFANGIKVFEGKAKMSAEAICRSWARDFDRELLSVAWLDIEIP